MRLLLVHSFLLVISVARAVTVYYGPNAQQPYGTVTAPSAAYSGAATYNNATLTPPPVPVPPLPTSFAVQLQTGAVLNLSIPQPGTFFGFSIEFSVVTTVLGLNSSFLQVPFLNLMANVRERAGSVYVRVGGNSQDYATLVNSTSNGSALEKISVISNNGSITPAIVFTPEIIKMMGQISSLTNVRWYLGIPFNDTQNWRLQIAEAGESILGDYLAGLQVANEPDLYSTHGVRPLNYSAQDYANDFGSLVQAVNADSNIPNKGNLIGPNIANVWKPEMVWNTGFVTNFKQNLGALAVERYPNNNCFAKFGIGTPITSQQALPSYLSHNTSQQILSGYLNSTAYAQAQGLPFLMLETNSASCGGFPGLSNSFAAALWAIDYSLQMAYGNFSRVLFHVSGQDVYYNPFTPPVTNQSSFHQWTIGPIYYSALFVAEALGSSNNSQVLDLQMNGANDFTPGYAIYENGQPTRIALINFVNDNSGNSDYTASISIGGGTVPSQVRVKYLSASSVTQLYNFTWAGQTFGDAFSSDGRPVGAVNIQTVTCDQTNNVCNISVPAPGAALVFLTDAALAASDPGPTMTFPTTVTTNTRLYNTATINPSVLATSNGNKGLADSFADTSQAGTNGALGLTHALPSIGALIAGALLVVRMNVRW